MEIGHYYDPKLIIFMRKCIDQHFFVRKHTVGIGFFNSILFFAEGDVIIDGEFNVVDGLVEIDLSTVQRVSKISVKKDKVSNTSVEKFSLDYMLNSHVMVYSDYPAEEPVQTVRTTYFKVKHS